MIGWWLLLKTFGLWAALAGLLAAFHWPVNGGETLMLLSLSFGGASSVLLGLEIADRLWRMKR